MPLATGRKFDTFIALSHYALVANPIIPKNLKIFVPYQFSVKFMSKKADKLKKILVLHPKIRVIFSFNFRFYKMFQLSVNKLYAVGKLIFVALECCIFFPLTSNIF